MEFIKTNIYYLNITELKSVCNYLDIPYNVFYKNNNNNIKTNLVIKKKYIIHNILRHLEKKKIKKVIISQVNVNFNELDKPTLNDNIYFGQFKWMNAKKLLKDCKPAICFFMLYDLWQKNKTFTYKYFITYYNDNIVKYEKDTHPEWKYIEHIRQGNTLKSWHSIRKKYAHKTINEIKN